MRRNRMLLLVFCIMLAFPLVYSASFRSIVPNKNAYSDGDLVYLKIRMDDPNLRINVDFSPLDSEFTENRAFVIHEEGNTTYEVYYPISYQNTRGDGTYPILINAYNTITGLSDAITYSMQLSNQANITVQEVTSGEIIVKVEEEIIGIEEGYVTVCTEEDDCKKYTEDEYDEMINTVIEKDLTNEQYTQILNKLDEQNMGDVKDAIIKAMQESTKANQEMVSNFQDSTETVMEGIQNVSQSQQGLVRDTRTVVLISIAVPILFIIFLLYMINVRINTTWYNK